MAIPGFICNYCLHVPRAIFHIEQDFIACSEGCYNLAREQDFLEALLMKEEQY